MAEAVVRPLRAEDDLHALTALLHAAYATLASQGWNFTAATQDAAVTRERVACGQAFVAEHGGRLVGTVAIAPPKPVGPASSYLGDAVPALYTETGTAILAQLAVHPQWRGRGLAERLMEAAEAWAAAQGWVRVALDTARPAVGLRRRYLRRGYRPAGDVQWSGKTYASVLMVKTLGPAMTAADEAVALVTAWWEAIQARDWPLARALLRDDARMHWPVTDEWFDDADTIVRAQSEYPEGWSLRLIEAAPLADGRVLARVEVAQAGRWFFAASLARVEAGRLAGFLEVWADGAEPPAWRSADRLGAWRRGGGQVHPAATPPTAQV